jgi:hypothetical protein
MFKDDENIVVHTYKTKSRGHHGLGNFNVTKQKY